MTLCVYPNVGVVEVTKPDEKEFEILFKVEIVAWKKIKAVSQEEAESKFNELDWTDGDLDVRSEDKEIVTIGEVISD